MKFIIDKQTQQDLELFEKSKDEKSVLALFDTTQTHGGRTELEKMFGTPVSDRNILEERKNAIRFFQSNAPRLELLKESYDFIEYYLRQQNVPERFSVTRSYSHAILYKLKPRNEFYIIRRGIRYLVNALNDVYEYMKQIDPQTSPLFIRNCREKVLHLLEKTSLHHALNLQHRHKLFPHEFGRLDVSFRKILLFETRDFLEIVYQFDAFQSIANCASMQGFSLPEFSDEPGLFEAADIFHPFLVNPVKNSIRFSREQNICFVTGPNMAGKSTLLKSLSLCAYLAHTGFPVPAKELRTSIFNGLLTTINLPDNLNKGYSHYYNEILRVKYVAEQIGQTGNLFVIFDEIFRGTNVKDAFDASLAVISAFARLHNSIFAISTHIIEIAADLEKFPSIFFKYVEAKVTDGIPAYTFLLKEGVTDERIGLYLLHKERVIETIENACKEVK